MHLIDQYAYTNSGRAVDPAYKAGLALVVLLLCLLSNRPAVGLLAAAWLWGLVTFWAGLPGRVFGRVLVTQGTFLVLALLGVAISFTTTPPGPAGGWQWSLGPVWLVSSPASLQAALSLLTRALGSAAALNFLALTTPLVDLVDLMRRWRLPPLLIDLMTVIYRFIFTLLESLDRMRTAQASRLGYINPSRSMVSAGLLGSRLFIDAYQRSRRLHTALESRGYSGDLRVLPNRYRRDWRLIALSGGVVASLLLAWLWG